MAAPATRRSATRRPEDRPPVRIPLEPDRSTAPAAPAPVPAADLAPVVGALIRTVQAALASAAADLGRGDMGANAALVRLGAHREDVETLRAFLAAQPRPAHIPEEF